jgi:pyruvate,water dikinase
MPPSRRSKRSATVRTLAGAVRLLDHAFELTLKTLIPYLASGIASGMAMLGLLDRLARGVPGGERLALEATRGLPHNVTTEMDLALWRAAQDRSPRGLDAFLVRYGMRGVGEIDIGRPRWRDDRSQLLQTIESYRRLARPGARRGILARRGVGRGGARAIADGTAPTLGRLVARSLARWAGRRMRALAGLREAQNSSSSECWASFAMRSLRQAGPISFPAPRRGRHARVRPTGRLQRRDRGAPRPTSARGGGAVRAAPVLSDGETFYGGEVAPAEDGERVLTGSGVSPGVIEGIARIVFDPRASQLAPGEILVCPGTDPAWTPLFRGRRPGHGGRRA